MRVRVKRKGRSHYFTCDKCGTIRWIPNDVWKESVDRLYNSGCAWYLGWKCEGCNHTVEIDVDWIPYD